ncbi:MAG: hypothetical protein IJW29_06585 [Clostridia bacterium]|nr:hypothetical protein [Clostridia bacterium]
MKTLKKALSLLLCAVLLSSALLLCACDKEESTTKGKPGGLPDHMMYYNISVNDYFGNPLAGIKATVYQNGTEVTTVTLGEDGTERVALDKGDYTVTLLPDADAELKSYFGYEFTYDESLCVLSEAAPDLTVTLMQKPNGREKIYFQDDSTALAAKITGGAYKYSFSKGNNYFLLHPSIPGIYEISIGTTDAEIQYLSSFNHETLSVSENGVLTLPVSRLYVGADESSTSPFLFCVDAKIDSKTDFVLTVKKVSDMPLSPSEVDWIEYKNPDTPEQFTLPEGATLTNVDVFDAELDIVFNENDGYYHVGSTDGPVVLIRLTSDSPYLANFFTICNTSPLKAYFYDEEGNFRRKEIYNTLIHQYTGEPDVNGSLVQGAGVYDAKTGTYPLDAHLAYFMKNAGEDMGWWNPDSYNFRFEDDLLLGKTLTENAWLFACCYVAE